MEKAPGSANPAWFEPLRRYVPLAVWCLVLLTLFLIPLKIIGYGYVVPDDALGYAAKAVSGKPWPEIVVLSDAYQIDPDFGWSLLLEKIHGATGADAEALMIFSFVSLFLLVSLAAIVWLDYPEAWLVALIFAAVTVMLHARFSSGRPFLITMAALLSVLLLWRRSGPAPPKPWMAAVMTAVVAVSVFFHSAWYLWALPVAAFLLAGQFRWGLMLAGCTMAGAIAGGTLTGHPLAYLEQTVRLAWLAMSAHNTGPTLAAELQPKCDLACLYILAGLLLLRRLAGLRTLPLLRDPVFWLFAVSWTLSLKVGRFGGDWGWPALMVLIACDLQLVLASRVGADTLRRLALAGSLALVTFLCLTSDAGSRWTGDLTRQYLTEAEHPELAGWMPEKGGILYSADTKIFYQTFYKNPRGDWQYLPGFEPAWMPQTDLSVYRKILWSFGNAKAYEPWVKKLRPEDRLVIRGSRGSRPAIPELEWKYGISGTWIGRVPGPHPESTAPTAPAAAGK
jgi:hypothetical protein